MLRESTGAESDIAVGSTYRVQLHANFGFGDAAAVVDYIAALGVTHLYCSPYLQAAPGSAHGYDVVDPQRFSSELGGAPGFAEMTGALREAGLRQVLDIVPNHMAVDPTNRWWWDVLENGPASRYARFFDVDWSGPDDRSALTVLVPVLGDHYGRILESGELWIERRGGEFVVGYHDHRLPLSPRTLDEVLATAARRAGSADLARVAEGFGMLPSARMTDDAAVTERHDGKLTLAQELDELCASDAGVAGAIASALGELNQDPDRLDALLRRQNYRLAHWRTASEELDYRRFFNIESLIGVRVEEPDVFAATHSLIMELVRDGTVHGLRIDHVDGLRDPEDYLTRLAKETGGVYTVVEKILGPNESLPASWPISGTSGYDFLFRATNLFVAIGNEQALSDCYASFSGESASYDDVVYAAKHQIMRDELSAEVEHVVVMLSNLTGHHRRHRDHTRRDLRDAVREFVAAFPAYRTYVRPDRSANELERRQVAVALASSRARRADLDSELVEFLGELALGAHTGDLEMEFAQRLQQLTAPVMAKGVEDTAFYRYHRLISLNEVGCDPGVFGRTVADFHHNTIATASTWPHSMLTLSTHDTKRSADVRARLNVLSELPDEWATAVSRWAELNERHRRAVWPDRNAEYLLYQTIVGAWPIDADRVVAFMAKATREAKVHTSWTDPVADYDEAVEAFVRAVLADRSFVDELETFLARYLIVERGRRNSLAQTTLLLTCPGVPDLYQGTELWDLSLVDPDNRRPVDYDCRRRLLEETRGLDPTAVMARGDSGAPKQWLIHRLLRHRGTDRAAYETAAYEPLELRGARADDALAFSRGRLVVVVPRQGVGPWAATTAALPSGQWCNVLTGDHVDGGVQQVGDLLEAFPTAVLARQSS